MYLLLNDRNMIIEINSSIKLQDDGTIIVGKYLVVDEVGMSIVKVDEVPIDIIPWKYFYINGEYELNPNWEESKLSQKVTELEKDNESLNETIVDLTDFVVSTII